MRPWKRIVLNTLRPIDRFYDQFKFHFKRFFRIGNTTPITILNYRSYGTSDKVVVKGRVIKEVLIQTTREDTKWKNFQNNLRRFLSTEIANAELEITINEETFAVKTDKEGYFDLSTSLKNHFPLLKEDWQNVEVKLVNTPLKKVEVQSQSEVLIPQKCNYGIISDIDDTILQTDVTSLLKIRMLYLTFLKNAFNRNVFKEAKAFYNALQKGANGEAKNPIFYVSNGPWNLYDFLVDFLKINGLPKGPILLRDFGIPRQRVPRNYQGHKKESIKKIMNTYPDLPFVLIGDSGEKDTDVYLALAKEFPGRVKSIYIRDVESPRRAKRIAQLIKNASGIDAYFVKDYFQAAKYASEKGYLHFDTFKSFRKKRRKS
jgi:phosphatidate phosphatase APP1